MDSRYYCLLQNDYVEMHELVVYCPLVGVAVVELPDWWDSSHAAMVSSPAGDQEVAMVAKMEQ